MKNTNNEIYLQPKEKVYLQANKTLIIDDLCEMLGPKLLTDQIKNIKIVEGPYDKNIFVITLFSIIQKIKKKFPETTIHVLGECDILIEIAQKNNTTKDKVLEIFKVTFVCFLLFIGAGIAIMNFHADVNMAEVHKNFYEIITGDRSENPLWISIPYSIGIGIGMIIFFNHISPKKRKQDHPSPLDLELYSYQNTHDDFVKYRIKERED